MNGPTRPNDRLPTDPAIRATLARRAAGRMPDDLTVRVFDALDHEPARPRPSWLPSAWSGRAHVPGPLAVAGGMAAALVLVAALILAPGLWPRSSGGGFAGYPADRVLTSIELAVLMNGPDLAPNTTLVASVTIDAKTDVCPMNRYPTIGIVEAMPGQVCVMGSGVSTYLSEPAVTGTFAFRYLARGYLGLLGEITPASSSKLAFQVADEWPLFGKTFLVEGWLGASGAIVICPTAYPAGDVLNPNGQDCPDDNWLADDVTAQQIVGQLRPAGTGTAGVDLHGNARFVEAGGARQIDAIQHAVPTRGVYVVRGVTSGCPDLPASSSVGCASWRVLAKVADVTLPGPTASSTPTPSWTPGPPETPVAEPSASPVTSLSPLGISGPGGTPLTVAAFQQAWASDPAHLAGRIAIIKGPVPTGFECRAPADATAPPTTCDFAVLDGTVAQEGYWAVRAGANGKMSIVGEVATTSNGSFVFAVGDNNVSSPTDQYRLVDGWLIHASADGCDVVTLPTSGTFCVDSYLTGMPGVTAFWEILRPGTYGTYAPTGTSVDSVHGLWLVHVCTACKFDEILARIEPVG
jgi:hypothetical protein